MYVNLDTSLVKTVTMLNKRNAKDAGTTKDEIYKTVITEAQWDISSESSMGDTTLDIGVMVRVQIPPENDGKRFLPYPEWARSPEGAYTASEGDIAILGEVAEDVSLTNLRDIMVKYKPNVCTIRLVNSKIDPGISPNSTGTLRFLNFVYLEGV